MNEKINYRLANIQQKEMKLRTFRRDILVSESEKALDMILDAPAPASLIQSFPDQDLYYLMHRIGPDDFIPVLALATSDQWEYILDVEVWDNDRLDLEYMTKTFDILFKADPQRLLRWIVKEKPDFFEFYLLKNMDIVVREHDEAPPQDFDDYITIDDKFYFRFPEKPGKPQPDNQESEIPESDKTKIDEKDMPVPKDSPEAWELIEKMVKAVAQMDLSVFHGLMLETISVLPAETEEEQFRLKNLRLAEKGFLPTHEAIGIYQPTKLNVFRKRPDIETDTLALNSNSTSSEPGFFDPDIPLPPQFFARFIEGDDLFVKSLQFFSPDFVLMLESELGALINKVISADKIKLRTQEDLEKAISKTCAYLNLGLEVILKGEQKPELAKDVIKEYFIEDIFRTGSRASIKLKTKAVNWFIQSFTNKNKLPLSFLGENFLGVVGGLFLDRPLYFDNYRSGELYTNFKSIVDITSTNQALDKIMAVDTVLGKLSVELTSFKEGVLTYKTLILTLWAKDRLHLEPNLEPIDVKVFKDFFIALFSDLESDKKDKIQLNDMIIWSSEATKMSEKDIPEAFFDVLKDLISELESEYYQVDPDNIDPRFIPHFLLKAD